MAAKVLRLLGVSELDRGEFLKLIEEGMRSVSTMLQDLKELARLEARRETREISEFDAPLLLSELCAGNRHVAAAQGLFLEVTGPGSLRVRGDSGRVRRLLQNLVLNALKYTRQGGITMSAGLEADNWWLIVKDTGPGLMAGTIAPSLVGLKEATAIARKSDENARGLSGGCSQVPTTALEDLTTMRSPQQTGEGIGRSIVKQLCELLEARLEIASSADTGTTFRIVFPGISTERPVVYLVCGHGRGGGSRAFWWFASLHFVAGARRGECGKFIDL